MWDTHGTDLLSDSGTEFYCEGPPCCMARGCGRTAPYPDLGSCEADVLRASELEYAVQHGNGDGHLGCLTAIGLRA